MENGEQLSEDRMDTVVGYAPGVCSMVKSKPGRIHRSNSSSHIDVRGSVVMEKVWMFEGMRQQSGISSSKNLSEGDIREDNWCSKHTWIFTTNLSPAQLCVKCNKRIFVKRGAYKCTACKQLSHLKCAIQSDEDQARTDRLDRGRQAGRVTQDPGAMNRQGQTCVAYTGNNTRFSKQVQTGVRAPAVRLPQGQNKTANQSREHRQSTNRSRERKSKVEHLDMKASSSIEVENFDDVPADCPSQALNTSRQSQAKLRLNSMKHGLVKRCRSLRDKVTSRKDKGGNSVSDDQATQGSQEASTSSSGDGTQANRDKEMAWLTSPVLARLQQRRAELASFRTNGSSGSGRGTGRRTGRRRHIYSNDPDPMGIGNRLTEVERKVHDIEGRLEVVVRRVKELDISSTSELERWHQHRKHYGMKNIEDCMAEVVADDSIHETHPKQLEAESGVVQYASQTSTSDEVYIVPDDSTSSPDVDDEMVHENGHMVHENGHMIHENDDMLGDDVVDGDIPVRLQNGNTTCFSSQDDSLLPSGIPSRLRTNGHSDLSGDYGDCHTSTPLTNREISFRSASRRYVRSESQPHGDQPHDNSRRITHTNITTIHMDSSVSERHKQREENVVVDKSSPTKSISTRDQVHSAIGNRSRVRNLKDLKLEIDKLPLRSFVSREDDDDFEGLEDGLASEQRVLSPEQVAVQSFLERRGRFVSPRVSTGGNTDREMEVQMESAVNCSDLGASPVASSTFQNGSIRHTNMNLSDMSPIVPSPASHQKLAFERVKAEMMKRGYVKPSDADYNSSASNFSYTFRNDSEMMAAGADDDFATYSRNLSPTAARTAGMNANNSNSNQNENFNQNANNSNFDSNPVVLSANPIQSNSSSCFQNATSGFSPDIAEYCRSTDMTDVEMDAGREVMSMTKRSSPALTATTDGTSLTNVTEFTEDYMNSFNDSEKTPTKSRWVNKDVFMFTMENDEGPDLKDIQKAKPVSTQGKIDGKGDGQKPPIPARRRKTGKHVDFKVEAEKRLRAYQNRHFNDVDQDIVLEKLPRPSMVTGPDSESDGGTEVQESLITKCVASERRGLLTAQPNFDFDSVTDSVREFEQLEKQMDADSKRNKFRDLKSVDPEHDMHTGASPQCDRASGETRNIDLEIRSNISESAKYHFLHDKGMTKISSPSLKLIHGHTRSASDFDRRNSCQSGHSARMTMADREESSDAVLSGSESEVSAVMVDSHFRIPELKHQTSLDSKRSGSGNHDTVSVSSGESGCHSNKSVSSLQRLENEILSQSLKMVDDSQQRWDDVMKWMNKDCDEAEVRDLENELEMMMKGEIQVYDDGVEHKHGHEGEESSHHSPLEESVYYSFQGQSEELKKMCSPQLQTQVNGRYRSIGDEDNIDGLLMYTILNGSVRDVEELLRSEKTIPEAEIKDALLWALEQEHFEITMLLLDDICKLIWAAEDEDCVDVFPAYFQNHPWQPMFVVLVRQHVKGKWDLFMGFDVYRRQYDLVSDEAALVINSELVRSNPLSLDDFRMVKEAISSAELDKRHSKITVVNACPCRSRKGGEVIEKQVCVVVHCLLKGFIPFGEDPFPREIDGIPVDVREGYFQMGVGHVSDIGRCIQMGDYSTDFVDGRSEGTGSEDNASDAEICATGSVSEQERRRTSSEDIDADWHLESQRSSSDRESLDGISTSFNGDCSESPRCLVDKLYQQSYLDKDAIASRHLPQEQKSSKCVSNTNFTADKEITAVANGGLFAKVSGKNGLSENMHRRLVSCSNGKLTADGTGSRGSEVNVELVPNGAGGLVTCNNIEHLDQDDLDLDPQMSIVQQGDNAPTAFDKIIDQVVVLMLVLVTICMFLFRG